MTTHSSRIAQNQSDVAAFMADSATYGTAMSVNRIDTHGAMVFLVEGLAYKVKRAVKFPYMDFSTLTRRRLFCEREVMLNRRTAPNLYRGTVPITRQADGSLALNGNGTVVEWAVAMRRFRQSGLLDHRAKNHGLTVEVMRAAAEATAAFHESAEILVGRASVGGGHAGIKWVIDENFSEMRGRLDLFPERPLAAFARRSYAELAKRNAMLDQRDRQGYVRRCHGDLHLRNICLIADKPVIFDGIEFEDRLSCIDVLYDLAFLLMDLEHRHLRGFANNVLNRYLQCFDTIDGLGALPLFQSTRACIRAKVAATAEASQQDAAARATKREEAQSYFQLAQTLLAPQSARLVAIGGLSGAGKSSLALRMAPDLGVAPGALHLRSDVIRKSLAGVGEHTRLPDTAYTASATDKVYTALAETAARALATGYSVIADAAYLTPAERACIENVAREAGASFCGIWLEAPEETLLQRVRARTGDASDATPGVVRQQLQRRVGEIGWSTLDGGQTLEAVTADANRLL